MAVVPGLARQVRTRAAPLLVLIALVAVTAGAVTPPPADAAEPKVQIAGGPLRSTRTVMAASGRTVYAVWEDWNFTPDSRVIRMAISDDRGQTWMRPGGTGVLANAPGNAPTIAAVGNSVYVAWEHDTPVTPTNPGHREIWYRESDNRGRTFGSIRVLDKGETTPADSYRPLLAASPSGAWVTWQNGYGEAVKVATIRPDQSLLVHDLGPGESPSIAAQGGGVLVAFERQLSATEPQEIWAAYSPDGTSFNAEVNLSASPPDGSTYAAATINDGDLHVAWHERSGATPFPSSIRVATSIDEGSSFGAPVDLGEAQPVYPWGVPSIAAYPGLVAVAWPAPGDRSVSVAASHDRGATFGSPTAMGRGRGGGGGLTAPVLAEDGPRAVFDWTMPERFGGDANGDGLIDETEDPAYISPPDWPVDLDGCASRSTAPGALTYQWKVDGAVVGGNTCHLTHTFPDLGSYEVELRVTQPGGLKDERVRTVDVRDRLVVSIGDSIASGEGTPDKPLPGLLWNDRQCDRSALAGPAQAALQLEQADPHSSVTFVHLACSGASIKGPDADSGGLLTIYDGINPGPILFPQVDAVVPLVAGREIDAMLVSIGANDAKFSEVVTECITLPLCNHLPTVVDDLDARLASLPGRYNELAVALVSKVDADRVYITEYPDPTITETGAWDLSCVLDGALPGGTITGSEARWASEHLMTELNGAVQTAATTHGWNFVGGISSGFAGKGYCAADHSVVQIEESQDSQDDKNGAFHPNAAGHQQYANRIATEVGNRWRAAAPTPPAAGSVSSQLGDLYLAWGDAEKLMVTTLVENSTGLAELETHVLSTPNNELGAAGLLSIAANDEGAWGGWTEQIDAENPANLEGYRAFVGTIVRGPPNFRPLRAGLVQGPSDPVALVAERTTAVEVVIDSGFTVPTTADVSYVIEQQPGDVPVASGTQTVSFTPGENPLLLTPSPAFLPSDGATYSARVTVDPGNWEAEGNEDDNTIEGDPTSTEPSRGLKIVYVPIAGSTCPSVFNVEVRSREFVEGVLPLPDGGLSSSTNCGMSFMGTSTPDGITGTLSDLGTLGKLAGADVLIGVTPPGWLMTALPNAVGIALVGGSDAAATPAGAALVDADQSGTAVTHEIIHTYGQNHVIDEAAPGWWVNRRTHVRGTDLMNEYLVETPWLSPQTYDFIRNRWANTLGDPMVITVRGTIDAAGTLHADPWFRSEGILDVPMGADGELTLEYRDAGGDVLATTGFDAASAEGFGATPTVAGGAAASEPRAFSVRVPDLPAGTTDLVLLDGTDTLLTRTVSDNAPTNEVTAPEAGAVIAVGSPVEVAISAADADGDDLTHALLVSPDDGATWRPLAIDATGDTFTFTAPADLVSTQVRVRVLTTDGVRTAIDDSAAFEISQDVPVDNRIVYVRMHHELNISEEGLWMMDPDGGNQVEVPLPDAPTTPHHLPHNAEPDWSPTGSHIVFRSDLTEDSPGVYHYGTARAGLWTVRPSGADLTQLTVETSGGFNFSYVCPSWSPDGTQITAYRLRNTVAFPYTATQSIVVMDSDGGNLHSVVDFPPGFASNGETCPVFSPDGLRLAFAAHGATIGNQIHVVDADGSDFGVLWSGPPPPIDVVHVRSLDWAPDGAEVVVTVAVVDGGVGKAQIWGVPADGGDPHLFFATTDILEDLMVTPDGSRLYGIQRFTAPTYTNLIDDFVTVALDGSDPQLVRAPANGYDHLSPDWVGPGAWEPPPTPQPASAGGPYAATEDVELQLDAGVSTLAATEVPLAEWDLDGDGAFDDAVGLRPDVTFPHAGPVTVMVRLTPAAGAAVTSAPLIIEVAPAPPSIVAAPGYGVVGQPTTLGAGFHDPGGEPHTASIDWGDGGAAQPATIAATEEGGTLSAPHTYAAVGDYTAVVQVCDDPGPCATAEVEMHIVATAPANLPPTAAPTTAVTASGAAVWVPLPATDPEGMAVEVDSLGAPAHGTVAPMPAGDGVPGAVYTPADGFVGVDTFTYTVSDGYHQSAVATVTVTVGNLPPVAGADSFGGDPGVPTVIDVADVLANDADPDATGALSVAGVYETPDLHGTVEQDGDTITYTPEAGFFGTATFEYAVSDGSAIGVGSVDVVIEAPVDVPGPPLDVSAIGADASADVDWNPPTSDGGSPITGYEVRIVGTATITPVAGAVEEATVTGLANGTDYTFEVRAQNATGFGPWSAPSNVARPRASCSVDAFSDVPDDHPFCPEIFWMADNGIAEGYPDGTYRPGAAVARQAMAAFLYRLAGSERGPDPACDVAPFPDVPVTHTFCGEIDWMIDEEITGGFADGTFRPAAAISRQAMAAFLYRLAGSERGPDPTCTSAPFTDVPASHPFCGEIDWMVDNGITGGFDDGTFRPVASISRQAMAAYIFRYDILTGILG